MPSTVQKSGLNICAQSSFSISNNSLAAMEAKCIFAPHDNDLSIVLSAATILSQPPPRWMRAPLTSPACIFFRRRRPLSWLRVSKASAEQVGPHFFPSFDFDPFADRWENARAHVEIMRNFSSLSLISSCWFYQVAMSESPQPWTTVPLL